MIRRGSKNLKISWISPTVGTFGAIREMVEVSNVLVKNGHHVAIYHPDGLPVKWLPSLAECRKLNSLEFDSMDVLIGIVDWRPELYQNLIQADAKVKAICLLGFHPSQQMANALRGLEKPQDEAQRIIKDSIDRKFLILADSSWQIEWVKNFVGYPAGPPFGGINLEMFYPAKASQSRKLRIIYSGDPRERKGTDTVEKAIKILKKNKINADFDFYWGKKFNQEGLVDFLQKGDIFLDGHRRAGWCNPVAEAVACGCVPICTDIGANRDFALDEKTALVVPVDDAEKMASAAVRLAGNPEFRMELREHGLSHIENYAYEKIVPFLESTLINRVYD